MRAARRWRGSATIGSALALALGTLALMPGAAAASTHACGNHNVVVEIENAPGRPKTKLKLQVKQIVTQGVSCSSAYKFLAAMYNETSGKTPEGYKCKIVKFKVPAGSIPEQCTKPGKKIQFAGRGG